MNIADAFGFSVTVIDVDSGTVTDIVTTDDAAAYVAGADKTVWCGDCQEGWPVTDCATVNGLPICPDCGSDDLS
jgi:Zn finger protein HypA/HybF involved in hydrogenase expression